MKTLLQWFAAPLALVLALSAPTAEAAGGKGKKKKDKKPTPEALFQKLDENKDGRLSPAEFTKLKEAKKAGKASKKPAKIAKAGKKAKGDKKGAKLFAKLDTNKDGYLSLDEFKKLAEAKAAKKKDKKK